MTAPTITYGHSATFTDCNEATAGWTEVNGGLGTQSISRLYDDIYDITCSSGTVGQYVYYHKAFTNQASAVYTHYVIRWKTDTSATFGAMAFIYFSDNSVQSIVGTPVDTRYGTLAAGLAAATPEFSTAWHVHSGTVLTGYNIARLVLVAKATGTTASEHVYFDFAYCCKVAFTFPSVSGKIHFEMNNRYGDIGIPPRIGNQDQYLGMESPDLDLDGKIDVNTVGWGTPYGEPFMLIMQEASADPFQWFTSDMVNCKVTPRKLILDQDGTALRTWQFILKQHSRSGGQLATWNDLQYWGV